jgi:MerR family transcriptional regulator, heat shock protein HspR
MSSGAQQGQRGDGARRARRSRTTTTASLDRERGVFMISVAAELAEMHPQTLRMYEARGLVTPRRSPKNTRLYSQEDVERLRRIQQMTVEGGLNLTGVETVLELEAQLERTRRELRRMRERAAGLERRMLAEVDRMRRSMRAEIVPYGAYETEGIGEPRDRVAIPIERSERDGKREP